MKEKKRMSLLGHRYGKWLVIEDAGRNKHNQFMWKCRCDCGTESIINGNTLRNSNSKSCGCLVDDKFNERPEHLHRRDDVPIKCGVYSIISPLGEVYIGHSRNIYYRWIRHREANRDLKIHHSLRRHGWKSHTFSIEHELSQETSDKMLIVYEQVYIDIYRSLGFPMLNVKEAGSAGKYPEESRLKMSKSHKKKEYKFMFNGEPIEIIGLKDYCEKNGLNERAMTMVYNNNGFYGDKNYGNYKHYGTS